jgi:hypothetical protein
MTEPEVRDEALIALLRERGYEVTREPEDDLVQKVISLEGKIEEMRNQAPSSPEEERQRCAEELLDTLNRSITKWHSPGEPPNAA